MLLNQSSEGEFLFQEGRLPTSLYRIDDLYAGDAVRGPAMLVDQNRRVSHRNEMTGIPVSLKSANFSTLLIEPNCVARALDNGNIRIDLDAPSASAASDDPASTKACSLFHW